MPTYAKFMKDILTKKMRYTDQETINLDVSYSVIIQRIIPREEIDPRRITLPLTIGNVYIGKALIDLGSRINLIPLCVVKRLGNIEVKPTKMTLKLAEKSTTRPLGVAEDVLVKVDKFLFPIDFVVIDMKEYDDTPLILDQRFTKTARMMIYIDDGLINARVQDEEVCFNLFEVMKLSKDEGDYFWMDATDEAVMDVRRQVHLSTPLEKALTDALKVLKEDEEKEIEECLRELESLEEIPPLEAKVEELKDEQKKDDSKVKLKILPSHLKVCVS
ncbi:uncharacterized protein LOC127082269 [Lathyrus oleraceus]|uniref:uncharacterized protein LOC127082269 n=1 Tax=Pisum sativum TaxID=3888 RepID=UPI0021D13107|nr:uncharacterized protein LOC127082269 [Pisum sativum]